jgi:glycosyltransferase involved in cell wall biosynthesis
MWSENCRGRELKILVTSPYREGAIVSIAAGAQRAGMLDQFYTTLYTPGLASSLQHLPYVGARLAAEFGRRGFSSIPPEKVKSFASVEELIRIAAFRGSTGFVDFPTSIMYWVKDRFDEAIARDLRGRHIDVVVGMWGSSSRTFEAAGSRTIKVLNFVNSRPRFHNAYLRDHTGLRPGNGELLSDQVSNNVEAEIALADIILVPSHFVATQLADHANKVIVAPYGVNLSDFSPGEPDPHYICDVLALGQISYRKGFTTLIEAAKQLPNLTFHAVGPIVAPNLLKDLPSNLKYMGLVLHAKTCSVMRSANVFVLASFEDAYPLVVLESMASGTPTIVSDHAGTAELISDGVDGLVFHAGDVRQLTDYIEKMSSDPLLRDRMAQAARSKVAASHSWDVYSDNVIKAILCRT